MPSQRIGIGFCRSAIGPAGEAVGENGLVCRFKQARPALAAQALLRACGSGQPRRAREGKEAVGRLCARPERSCLRSTYPDAALRSG
jgi:hypothetical protein